MPIVFHGTSFNYFWKSEQREICTKIGDRTELVPGLFLFPWDDCKVKRSKEELGLTELR
jgi:hypothetical protein